MRLHIVAAAYRQPIAVRGFIDSLVLQSYKNWMAYIVHDGPPEADYKEIIENDSVFTKDPRIGFYHSETRVGHNGHVNRRDWLDAIIGAPDDYVLMTNCDNYYVPYFMDIMLKEAFRDVGVVYCDFASHHVNYEYFKSTMKLSGIDLGAFIVRLDVAQKVRFTHVDYLPADGLYAEECAAYCNANKLRIMPVRKPIFIHN